MVPKRAFHGDSGNGADSEAPNNQESKRFKSSIREVLGMLSMEDMASKMEPFIRRVIRDEVERTVQRILQPSSSRPFYNQPETSVFNGFKLQFVTKPRSTIFTGSKIDSAEGNPIRIVLIDSNTNTIITSGPLSCIKIEILVLDADFGSDEKECWSESEFNSNIVREREGRRPLVTGGDLIITLKAGVGLISDVVFTDNSSWQRNRKFKLGARNVARTSGEMRIQEARSEAFVVKDHRGELYKKHHPPSFNDEVWRLEKIAKDGASHKNLAKSGIDTVGKFLRFYAMHPSELRNTLPTGISNKIWETIIHHASSCVLDDDQLYIYFDCGQTFGLLFNAVYKVVGVTYDGQNYEPIEKIPPHHKAMVENLKRQAYANVQNFIPIDGQTISGPLKPLICLPNEPFQPPNLSLQQHEFPQQGQQDLLDFNATETENQLQFSSLQNNHPLQSLPQLLRNSFKFGDLFSAQPYTGETSSVPQWSPATSSSQQLLPDDISQSPTSMNTFIFSNEGEIDLFSSYPKYARTVHMSRIRKPRAGWCKLRAAIKLSSHMAAKRMWPNSFCVD